MILLDLWREISFKLLERRVFVVPTICDYCGICVLDCVKRGESLLLESFDDLGPIQIVEWWLPDNNLIKQSAHTE